MYYTSPESMTLFRALYYNQNKMAENFLKYWAFTSSYLSNNSYIIGYDPINEPMPSWEGIFDMI
jgi:hypothetical protein